MSEATTQREKLLEINHLKKYFHVKNGLLHAVDDVSFYIEKGETLGLVGESGCGKSTTGRTIIRLLEADGGEVIFHGKNIHDLNGNERLPPPCADGLSGPLLFPKPQTFHL